MFNNILFYLVIGLSASTAALGWLSLSLHDDKVVAVEALKEAKEAIAGYQKALNLKYLSCQIDDTSSVELESDKTVLKDKTDVISEEISKLPTGIKKLPTTNNITEAPKNAEESNVLTGGELLSDDLRKLLLQAYCNVETTDNKCFPSR